MARGTAASSWCDCPARALTSSQRARLRPPLARPPVTTAGPASACWSSTTIRTQRLFWPRELRGCEVRVAFDAAAALRLAASGSFDLALLDIGLPVMDGYELAGRLRELGHDEPLLALTGYGQPADSQHAAAAGFQRHLVKPVDLNELDRVAELWLAAGSRAMG